MACTADKPDLVKALLCAGADLNTLGEQKDTLEDQLQEVAKQKDELPKLERLNQ